MSESSAFSPLASVRCGVQALIYTGKRLPLQVLRSTAGYYIGTHDEDGPVSRESFEYFRSREAAQRALVTQAWTQRSYP